MAELKWPEQPKFDTLMHMHYDTVIATPPPASATTEARILHAAVSFTTQS